MPELPTGTVSFLFTDAMRDVSALDIVIDGEVIVHDALDTAVAAQRALDAEPWSAPASLQVRMVVFE
jgi:hypothetical protein